MHLAKDPSLLSALQKRGFPVIESACGRLVPLTQAMDTPSCPACLQISGKTNGMGTQVETSEKRSVEVARVPAAPIAAKEGFRRRFGGLIAPEEEVRQAPATTVADRPAQGEAPTLDLLDLLGAKDDLHDQWMTWTKKGPVLYNVGDISELISDRDRDLLIKAWQLASAAGYGGIVSLFLSILQRGLERAVDEMMASEEEEGEEQEKGAEEEGEEQEKGAEEEGSVENPGEEDEP